MKITQIDIMTPHIQENPMWRPILCRIHTDEGIYGDGEAALAYGIASPAAAGMIRDLATLIIGMDPLDSEVIWTSSTSPPSGGRTAAPWSSPASPRWTLPSGTSKARCSMCLSTSCWAASAGTICAPMPASSSRLSDHAETLTTLDEYREVSKKAVAEGYDAIKIDFFTYAPEDGRVIQMRIAPVCSPPSW